MRAQETLIRRFESGDANVAIIGLGYVGLPLLLGFAEEGFRVIGIDIDPQKIEALNCAESYLIHIPNSRLAQLRQSGKMTATTEYSSVQDAQAIIICVPTPLNRNREPDLSFINNTIAGIRPFLRSGQLIVLESTTYPGTTDEILQNLIEEDSFLIDRDFFLAFSPEREDPGNKEFDLKRTPKIVGGVSKDSTAVASALYRGMGISVFEVGDSKTAEAVKLTENIFRAVNIALMNELKLVYERMGIDIWEVIEGAATKPFGYMPFYPGPGLGGHCIPIDPFYLSWRARAFNIEARFIELAGEVNRHMPEYVVQRVGEALNFFGKPYRGSKILLIGVAYKPNVNDIRESPSLVLFELLLDRGCLVEYFDPYVQMIPHTREHKTLEGISSIQWSEETLASFDCILICTNHDAIDYTMLSRFAKAIVDTRNVMEKFNPDREKLFKA